MISHDLYRISIFKTSTSVETLIQVENDIYSFETFSNNPILLQVVSEFCFKIVGCIHNDGMIHCYCCRSELIDKIKKEIEK